VTTVVAMAPEPSTTSISRERARSIRNGGRLSNGTAQIVFIAFCIAPSAPSPPQRAPTAPTTTATLLPWNWPMLLASWSPKPGNRSSTELTTDSWAASSSASTKPTVVVSRSSSGNSEKNV
jgi:hypothetical protein